ncbi:MULTISPECIES: genetic competence negative regulator [Bacillus]|uniref:genetic competence negative regulator n=1 Tax=Bacillus TaxID=1386 RepID=UPI000BB88F33|nr:MULTISPECIES: genetic competence negative regulator [Bacillus]
MRLERITNNKIKVFLTFDDLSDRGLTKEDLWQDSEKVHQLFRDMMDSANDELGFEVNGSLAVEVYSLQAQGMVIIVTVTDDISDEEFLDDYIEMQVTIDESEEVLYEFSSFEHIIDLAKRLKPFQMGTGKLYSYQDLYFLLLEEKNNHMDIDTLISLLSEYGCPATMTIHRIHEYGKIIMEENALSTIRKYFKNAL